MKKYKLGELIELTDERNSMGKYSLEDVKGISTEKNFINTKANMDGVSLDSYKIVNYRDFVYVPDTSRRGGKIALAFNNDSCSILISSIYTTFRCSRFDLLIPEFLYIYFNRPEFDRYSRFNSWGSARETFSWEDFCDIEITLPPIEQQRKYVDVYLALQQNLAAYQSKADELKLVCDGYLDKLKAENEKMKIGDYIEVCDERNSDNQLQLNSVKGLSTEKSFIDTKADMNGVSLTSYKVVGTNTFVYVSDTSRRGDKIAIALNRGKAPLLVSSIYTTFKSKDTSKLLPEYLFMYFNRPEFDRYARFNSWGSAREVFTMEDMKEVAIPIPDISVQREIVNIHKCYIERQRIANALKEQLKNICPILIRGSLKEEES
ncbi:MAG: restriction endonuclease subunit S [Bacteroidales bacterium]|nr:restriction endonuclease subunit S [Candidatus Colimorpha onthohippi]